MTDGTTQTTMPLLNNRNKWSNGHIKRIKAWNYRLGDIIFSDKHIKDEINSNGGVYLKIEKKYLYQDSAGTTPVTADGDPVGLVKDASNNGNDAVQSTSADRPTYKTDGINEWLLFNGSNTYMTINNKPLNVETFTSIVVAFPTSDNRRILDSRGVGSVGTAVGVQQKAGDANGGYNIVDDGNSHYLLWGNDSFLNQVNIFSLSYNSDSDFNFAANNTDIAADTNTGSIGSIVSGQDSTIGIASDDKSTQPYDGRIYTIAFIQNTKQSSSQITKEEMFFDNKYNTEWS